MTAAAHILSYLLPFILFTDTALGCSVCGFGEDPARWAFILTTGILTFVPLIAIGSVVFYVWRRGKNEFGTQDK